LAQARSAVDSRPRQKKQRWRSRNSPSTSSQGSGPPWQVFRRSHRAQRPSLLSSSHRATRARQTEHERLGAPIGGCTAMAYIGAAFRVQLSAGFCAADAKRSPKREALESSLAIGSLEPRGGSIPGVVPFGAPPRGAGLAPPRVRRSPLLSVLSSSHEAGTVIPVLPLTVVDVSVDVQALLPITRFGGRRGLREVVVATHRRCASGRNVEHSRRSKRAD
jgi:hypothetical protein